MNRLCEAEKRDGTTALPSCHPCQAIAVTDWRVGLPQDARLFAPHQISRVAHGNSTLALTAVANWLEPKVRAQSVNTAHPTKLNARPSYQTSGYRPLVAQNHAPSQNTSIPGTGTGKAVLNFAYINARLLLSVSIFRPRLSGFPHCPINPRLQNTYVPDSRAIIGHSQEQQ